MCDYGVSDAVLPSEMIAACEEAVRSLPLIPETLVISPSGSMFDEWEVPVEARRRIFSLVAGTSCARFICETRPETVSEAKLREYRRLIPDKQLGIEMGIESSDQQVLRNSISKSIDLEQVKQVVALSSSNRIATYANVLLGPPFLTQRAAIDDAVKTILWCFDVGFDRAVVFPTHVKPWTVTQWLWERGLYRPPSLWSIVEVIMAVGPERAERVYVSWYRPNYSSADTAIGRRSLAVPTTCVQCRDTVLELLDRYRRHAEYAILIELERFTCDCKDRWRRELEAEPDASLTDQILAVAPTLEDWLDRGARTRQPFPYF